MAAAVDVAAGHGCAIVWALASTRYSFPRSCRLSGKRQFAAVFEARVRETRGPLRVHARPNDLPHCRLGISIARGVGTAARRNRIKRLLREAFRLGRHSLPGRYDLVVVPRPHSPMALAEYERILKDVVAGLDAVWRKKITGC